MLSICRITIIIFIINILLLIYTAYVFYFKFNDNSQELFQKKDSKEVYLFDEQNVILNEITSKNNYSLNDSNVISIEIWSKASIGFYLWQHILRAPIDSRLDTNVYQSGSTKIDRFKFKFRSGALLTTDSLEHLSTENLILVLNGRDKEKVKIAIDWIKAVESVKHNIRNVGLVVLGDEKCHNHWLTPYLKTNGGFVSFLLIVYDWKYVDNQIIYQWPLGVATYRHFPNIDLSKLNLGTSRPYVCNFVATVYPDSSRKELANILRQKYEKICIIKTRFEWQSKETIDSLNYYVESLRLSDLTLSPIGMNHECYRIFEAMAFGSVPVVEENLSHVTKTSCDTRSAYRLLKENNAPLIYVSNWTKQLPDIIANEMNLSQEFKIQRRLQIIKFYTEFKTIIKNRFLRIINEKFV